MLIATFEGAPGSISASQITAAVVAHETQRLLAGGVVLWSDIRTTLSGDDPLPECDDAACFAEAAAAFDVPLVITGSIVEAGDGLWIDARLLDAPSGAVRHWAQRRLGSAAELVGAAADVAAELVAAMGRRVGFNAVQWVDVYVDEAPEPAVRWGMGRFSIPLTYGTHHLRFENTHAVPRTVTLEVGPRTPPGDVVIRLQRRRGR